MGPTCAPHPRSVRSLANAVRRGRIARRRTARASTGHCLIAAWRGCSQVSPWAATTSTSAWAAHDAGGLGASPRIPAPVIVLCTTSRPAVARRVSVARNGGKTSSNSWAATRPPSARPARRMAPRSKSGARGRSPLPRQGTGDKEPTRTKLEAEGREKGTLLEIQRLVFLYSGGTLSGGP